MKVTDFLQKLKPRGNLERVNLSMDLIKTQFLRVSTKVLVQSA